MSTRQYSVEIQDQLDYAFIQKIQSEVTQSCALPFAVPIERIPAFIRQAADWFYMNSPYSFEMRNYIIPYKEICHGNVFNKLVQLPEQILSVYGCYKAQQNMTAGAMGDFSMSRMMMSSYSMFGGVGSIGTGMGQAANGGAGYALQDVVTALYEVDTFNQTLNPPLSYDYNTYSHKLVILGDLGHSNVVIECTQKLPLQDLYNDPYFFRYVVALVKKSLNTIYGTWEFKYPGGVTINISNIADDAKEELDEIKEWMEKNQPADYFFMPNTM